MYQDVQKLKNVLGDLSRKVTVSLNVEDVIYRRGVPPLFWQYKKEINTVLVNVGFTTGELSSGRLVFCDGESTHLSKACTSRYPSNSYISFNGFMTTQLLQPGDNVCMSCDELFTETFDSNFSDHVGMVFAEYVLACRLRDLVNELDLFSLEVNMVGFYAWSLRSQMNSYVREHVDLNVEPTDMLQSFLHELTKEIISLQDTTVKHLKEVRFSECLREKHTQKVVESLRSFAGEPTLPVFNEPQVVKISRIKNLLNEHVTFFYPRIKPVSGNYGHFYVILPGDVAALCVEYVQKYGVSPAARGTIFAGKTAEFIPATDLLLAHSAVQLHEEQRSQGILDAPCSTLHGAYQVALLAHQL